jgi:predicted AAA+ superfamily ATPase
VLDASGLPSHYASADELALRDRAWIEAQWEIGRLRAREGGRGGAVLVLDEIQKITGWSEVVKRLWDDDTASAIPLRTVLLGSAPLLVQRGLTESLAGRFELIHVTHWSFGEMRDAFGWDLDRYLYFGGYPGAAELISDHQRWANYILYSLVETTLSRDILLLTRVDKPALLRQLFRLGCDYSAQILSYQKMLGQLEDAVNTTTLAQYLELLSGAGLITGLQKFSGARVRQRGSSPKVLVLNTALMTIHSGRSFRDALDDREYWGRLVESAVGAHLVNGLAGTRAGIYYWRDRGYEVDYVIQANHHATAIEVTSGRRKDSHRGMEVFSTHFRLKRKWLVGGDGIRLDEFLGRPAEHWLQ